MSRRVPSLADAVVPLLVATIITVAGTAHSGGAQPFALILGAGAGLSLFGRRRAPGVTLAVSGALTLALLYVDGAAGATAVIAPAVALYSLALRRGTRARVTPVRRASGWRVAGRVPPARGWRAAVRP